MKPPTDLLHKGDAVEEWLDLRCFRPLGARLVRWLAPTRVTPDQVTGAALLLGLAAGHLFFYPSALLNALGLALFLCSEVLDSADGQLARLRGSATRFGAVLDGISDNVRFLNLYVHLLARALLHSGLPPTLLVVLALLAGASHALQSSIVDFLKQVFVFVTTGSARLDLPEDLAGERPATIADRLILALYRPYVTRQARWCPRSALVVREIRRGAAPATLPSAWARAQAGVLASLTLIAQNIRFLLLAVTALPGWPEGFFWLTVGPLNLALAWILLSHERTAARLARSSARAAELLPAADAP
ncbi:MAG TPA: CDP-alcohol phosphatidyltransferase family protein [Gemmatimonadales bacterium]|nr:CDP-alcohol phosphatidyltransferase family protein [Gemmatimonadales bacterium]